MAAEAVEIYSSADDITAGVECYLCMSLDKPKKLFYDWSKLYNHVRLEHVGMNATTIPTFLQEKEFSSLTS